ncbi:MAG: peptidylprolyl isomerase [Anaerolineales bacterium]
MYIKRRNFWKMWLGLLLLAVLAGGCRRTDAPALPEVDPTETPLPAAPESTASEPTATATPAPLAAVVNGEPIPLAEFERQIASYEASMAAAGQDPSTAEGQASLARDREWVLDRLIEQILIEQAAQKAGVTVSQEEVDANITSLKEEIGDTAFQQWLEQEGLTEAQMREMLRREMIATKMANQVATEIPTRSDHIHARHIVVATPEEAQQVLAQVQAGADFAKLAQSHSQDGSTRDNGGDLGYFPRGVLTSLKVEEAAFQLQPGQVSEIISSSLGYHIIQVIDRTPDQEISPENMRLIQDRAVRQWLDQLWAEADIQRFPATATDASE